LDTGVQYTKRPLEDMFSGHEEQQTQMYTSYRVAFALILTAVIAATTTVAVFAGNDLESEIPCDCGSDNRR
jgi:hypothetical protein